MYVKTKLTKMTEYMTVDVSTVTVTWCLDGVWVKWCLDGGLDERVFR